MASMIMVPFTEEELDSLIDSLDFSDNDSARVLADKCRTARDRYKDKGFNTPERD